MRNTWWEGFRDAMAEDARRMGWRARARRVRDTRDRNAWLRKLWQSDGRK